MINYIRASEEHIDELTELRTLFLMEIYKTSNENDRQIFTKITKEYLDKSIKTEDFIAWIAIDNGKIVATSGLCIYKTPPNKSCINGLVGYIQNMYTIEDYRRQGIAAKIFKKILEEAKSRGCNKVTLSATLMGRSLYEKNCFKAVKDEMELFL